MSAGETYADNISRIRDYQSKLEDDSAQGFDEISGDLTSAYNDTLTKYNEKWKSLQDAGVDDLLGMAGSKALITGGYKLYKKVKGIQGKGKGSSDGAGPEDYGDGATEAEKNTPEYEQGGVTEDDALKLPKESDEDYGDDTYTGDAGTGAEMQPMEGKGTAEIPEDTQTPPEIERPAPPTETKTETSGGLEEAGFTEEDATRQVPESDPVDGPDPFTRAQATTEPEAFEGVTTSDLFGGGTSGVTKEGSFFDIDPYPEVGAMTVEENPEMGAFIRGGPPKLGDTDMFGDPTDPEGVGGLGTRQGGVTQPASGEGNRTPFSERSNPRSNRTNHIRYRAGTKQRSAKHRCSEKP